MVSKWLNLTDEMHWFLIFKYEYLNLAGYAVVSLYPDLTPQMHSAAPYHQVSSLHCLTRMPCTFNALVEASCKTTVAIFKSLNFNQTLG